MKAQTKQGEGNGGRGGGYLVKIPLCSTIFYKIMRLVLRSISSHDIAEDVSRIISCTHAADKNLIFGPSEVRALPLAAGINVGGHYAL